jgi:hypothetical protein
MNRFLPIILMITFKFHDNLIAQSKLNSLLFKNNLAYFEGNVNKLDFLSQINFDHQDSISDFSISYRIFYGELNLKKNNLEHQVFVNYDYMYKSLLSPFIGLSSFSNEFKGFKVRNNLLLGVKWSIFNSSKSNFSISAALTAEYNKFSTDPLNINVSKNENYLIRYSFRPKFKFTIFQFEFFNETFYQPNTILLNDYIIQSRSDINYSLSKKVALLISYIFYYNNQPAFSTLKKRDQKLMLGIEFKL